MRIRPPVLLAPLVLTVVLACRADRAAVPADLERDLQGTATLDLAGAGGERILTADEMLAGRGTEPSRKARVQSPIASGKNPEIVAQIPDPEGAILAPKPDSVLVERRPRPMPIEQPKRTGPYKTTSEVIRDAPFPINP